MSSHESERSKASHHATHTVSGAAGGTKRQLTCSVCGIVSSMRSLMKGHLFAAAAVAGILWCVAATEACQVHEAPAGSAVDEPEHKDTVAVGEKVPDFSVQTLDGENLKLTELQRDEKRTKTGIVALSFWCSTCSS